MILPISLLPILIFLLNCFTSLALFFFFKVELSPPFVGDTVLEEVAMDQPPTNPDISGQTASKEKVGEPEQVPDLSVVKEPKPEQVPDLNVVKEPKPKQVLNPSTTQDPEGAQVPDLAMTKDSEPEQTPGLTTTMVPEPEQIPHPTVTKESTKTATSLMTTGTSCLISSFSFS